jgi:hypothetical protein
MLLAFSRRIIFVAVVMLVLAATGHAATDVGARLEIVGHQIVDNTVVVGIENSAVTSQRGLLSLRVRIPQGTYATGTVVTVPGQATVAVSVPLPFGSTLIRVIHVDVQTLPPKVPPSSEEETKPGGGSGGGKGDRGGEDGDQITEGPDPF